MANIKLKDINGVEQTYNGINKIKVKNTEGQDIVYEQSSISGYKVTFIVDNLTYQIVNVPANTSISAPPIPTKSGGYAFLGWTTVLGATNYITFPYTPTSDIVLYCNWVAGGYSFATDSWSIIAAAIKSGNDNYNLGDTKTDTITISGTSYPVTFKIIDNKVGRYKTQSGVSHKVIEMQTLTGASGSTGVAWNSSATSFKNSNLFTWMNSSGLSQLPSALQAVLETTTVYSGPGNANATSANLVAATGKLFAACMNEYYGANASAYGYSNNNETKNNEDGELKGQFTWYQQQGVSTSSYAKLIKQNLQGTNYFYWTRCPCSSTSAVDVYDNGLRLNNSYSSTDYRACLCFAW